MAVIGIAGTGITKGQPFRPQVLPRSLPFAKGQPFKPQVLPGRIDVQKGQPFQPQVIPRTDAPATAPTATPAANNAATPAAAKPSPLDSTYFANVAANQAKINSQIAALGLRQGDAQSTLQQQLAGFQHQEPLDQLHLEQQANNRGALYSTVYNQDLGNLEQSYTGKTSAANDTYARLVQSLAAQQASLQQSEPLYEAQQWADAAARAAANAAKNPALGEPGPATGGPAAGAGTAAAGAGAAATGVAGTGITKGQPFKPQILPRINQAKGQPFKPQVIARAPLSPHVKALVQALAKGGK